MASPSTHKMTFSFPEKLAAQLMQRIPARQRSRYVADAIAARLAEQDRELREAAAIVNACSDIRQLEKELDALPDIETELGIKNGTRFVAP
jgi:metal-responsive CopG/Arc/MetJ family transcriptional regulator